MDWQTASIIITCIVIVIALVWKILSTTTNKADSKIFQNEILTIMKVQTKLLEELKTLNQGIDKNVSYIQDKVASHHTKLDDIKMSTQEMQMNTRHNSTILDSIYAVTGASK